MLNLYMQPEQQMLHYLLSLVNFVTLGSTNYSSIYFSSKSENMGPVNRNNSRDTHSCQMWPNPY